MESDTPSPLIEKIRREKTWHVRCNLILLFHIGEAIKHDGVRGSMWRMEDTARVLNLSIGYVSESIKLGKAFRKWNGLDKLTREKALEFLKSKED